MSCAEDLLRAALAGKLESLPHQQVQELLNSWKDKQARKTPTANVSRNWLEGLQKRDIAVQENSQDPQELAEIPYSPAFLKLVSDVEQGRAPAINELDDTPLEKEIPFEISQPIEKVC